MTIERTSVRARGLEFDALTAGPKDGPLVLLLHGFPQTSACWTGALQTLGRAGWHAVAPDQRGYSPGANPEDVAAYRVSELARDAGAIATALGAERFHLVGHDWGGTVGWALAGAEPSRVLSFTSVSTPHTLALARALRGTQQRTRMAYVPVLQLPRVAEVLFATAGGVVIEQALVATGLPRRLARRDVGALRRVGAGGALNWYRALRLSRDDEIARPREVSVPTLFVWGTNDVAFGREAAEATQRYVTGPYHLLELVGASHWIPDLNWDEIADVVLAHLADASPRKRRPAPKRRVSHRAAS